MLFTNKFAGIEVMEVQPVNVPSKLVTAALFANKLAGIEEIKREVYISDLDSRRTIELLTPDTLKQRGETEFHKRFHLLYPNFSKNISATGVALSRREEILCMLIVLGHDNGDIASILNIERKSVIVARYRLRRKLNLPEESSLDLFLKNAAV